MHAANIGAQVINISEAACYKVTRPINETGLGAAINCAVNVKGAVIIVAAGNTGQDCTQNPPPDPAIPADPRGWKQVQTIVSPAWYSPLVLTVGGIGQNGQPSTFSMSGPWLGAAAPAENIIALGYDGKPVNALQGQDGPIPIAGTSFAAAYVSGLAALVKQRFPDLTPAQIINRITATARHPGGGVDNYVGAGVIDPVAALTWDIPPGPKRLPYKREAAAAAGVHPAARPGPDHLGRRDGCRPGACPRSRRAGPARIEAPMKNFLSQFGLRFTTGHLLWAAVLIPACVAVVPARSICCGSASRWRCSSRSPPC